MKRVVTVFVLVIVLFLLVGCSSGDSITQLSTGRRYVENYDITTLYVETDDAIELNGKYTGDIFDGFADGYGQFTYEDNGIYLEYSGEFKNGLFNGYGELIGRTDDSTSEMYGTFTDGEFTPTVGESFYNIGLIGVFTEFDVSDAIIDYIDENEELFSNDNADKVKKTNLVDFSAKKFIKTGKQEAPNLVKVKLDAIQVFENDFYTGKLTSILGVDKDGNYYTIYYLGSVEIYDGDKVTAYAVPCSTGSFENISGGITNVIVMIAAHLE